MKRLLSSLCIALVALSPRAEPTPIHGDLRAAPPYHASPDRSLLRANVTFTPDFAPGEDLAAGFELVAGVPVQPLDTLAISFGHTDGDDSEISTVVLFAEETYATDFPLMPYVAAGLGYGWSQMIDHPDQDSLIAEAEAGLKIRPCRFATFHAGLEYNWADKHVFPSDDNGQDDKQWRVVAGITWLY
jgi:hypothetical protein